MGSYVRHRVSGNKGIVHFWGLRQLKLLLHYAHNCILQECDTCALKKTYHFSRVNFRWLQAPKVQLGFRKCEEWVVRCVTILVSVIWWHNVYAYVNVFVHTCVTVLLTIELCKSVVLQDFNNIGDLVTYEWGWYVPNDIPRWQFNDLLHTREGWNHYKAMCLWTHNSDHT